MKLRVARTVLGACLLLLAGLLASQPAAAQLRVCGPGEAPVGWDRTNPSVPVPLCPGGGSAPPPAASDTYAGMAFHPDAADVWVIGNYNGPNTAVARAIAACNAAMGGGCKSHGDWWNTSMEIIASAYGDFHVIWGANGKQARKELMAKCQKDQVLPCVSLKKFPASVRAYLPRGDVRKRYASSASVEALDRQSNLYIASGHLTFESADQAALQACNRANPGQKCILRQFSGNGFLQVFKGDEKLYILPEISASRAQAAAKAYCKQKQAKSCSLGSLYDARKAGQFVHDYSGPTG